MNKRQRKKAEGREVNRRILALWNYELKGYEPCDDMTCESCYVQPGAVLYRGFHVGEGV